MVPPKIGVARITYPTDIYGRCRWFPPFPLGFSCLQLDSRFFRLICGNGHFPVGPSNGCPNQRESSIRAKDILGKESSATLALAHVPNVSPRPKTGLSAQNPSIAGTVIAHQDTTIKSFPTSIIVPFLVVTQSWLSDFLSCRTGCFTNCWGQKITRDICFLWRIQLFTHSHHSASLFSHSFVGLGPGISWRWSSMMKPWRVHRCPYR